MATKNILHPRLRLITEGFRQGSTFEMLRKRVASVSEYKFGTSSYRGGITNEHFINHPLPISSVRYMLAQSATIRTSKQIEHNFHNHVAYSRTHKYVGTWVVLGEFFGYMRRVQHYNLSFATFVYGILYVEFLQLHCPTSTTAKRLKLLMEMYFEEWNEVPPLVAT